MQNIKLEDLHIKGELAVRLGLNFMRLEGEWYRPDEVFTADQHGWPGDWEGRLILALSLLAESTHRTAAYLDEIIEELPNHFNEKGYLGTILCEGRCDEQQMAGHSWLIRGLIEYYKLTGHKASKNWIETIVNSLLLPARGKYQQYPIHPETRLQEQDIWCLSKLQSKSDNHAETSDAGCAFIMLDGAVAAYELLGLEELRGLIEEMVNRYLEMDLLTLHIQTHATLSACRGIFRYYELTGCRKYLEAVERIIDLYCTEAWSEAYGNYNWFGIPKWTESCAIIDSFILTVSLWKATRNIEYLERGHVIYFNAVCHGQRISGGFGTDCCTGAASLDKPYLLKPVTYDVYWCCNMRGGEGLTRAAEYSFFTEGEAVYIPFYYDCTAKIQFADGIIELEEKSRYPYEGNVSFKILEVTARCKRFHFYIPSWDKPTDVKLSLNGKLIERQWENGFLCLAKELKRGDCITLKWPVEVRAEPAVFKNSTKGYHKFCYGSMLLGCAMPREDEEVVIAAGSEFERVDKSSFRAKVSGQILTSLCDVAKGTTKESRIQVLFSDQSL